MKKEKEKRSDASYNDFRFTSLGAWFFVFVLNQFYIPFKIISAHMRRANQ